MISGGMLGGDPGVVPAVGPTATAHRQIPRHPPAGAGVRPDQALDVRRVKHPTSMPYGLDDQPGTLVTVRLRYFSRAVLKVT
jgi:hypothetical protein